jgi:hypothetical protein
MLCVRAQKRRQQQQRAVLLRSSVARRNAHAKNSHAHLPIVVDGSSAPLL